MYQNFLNKHGEDHATQTVKKVHIYTRACLRDALHSGAIFRDPTYNVTVVGKNPQKIESNKYLSEHEAIKLLKETKSDLRPQYVSKYMIIFALATGVRFSEALGLTWDCVDFKEKTVRIEKTWDYTFSHDFSSTKNEASKRVIAIDDETLKIIKDLKLYQSKIQLQSGIRNVNNLVFVNRYFETITSAAVNNVLKKLCSRLKLTEVTFHSLRHTHASLMIYKGVNIKYLSRRLGHDTIMTTYKTYGHIIDEMEQRENKLSIATIESLYKAAKT